MKRLLVMLVAVALAASACGDGVSDNPKKALRTALENLAKASGVSVRATLATDTGSLRALSEGAMSEEDAQKILDSSLRLSSLQGDKPADSSAEVILNVAGEDSLIMRVVGEDLYAQADVEHFVETFGGDPAQVDAFAQNPPAGFEWLSDAARGEWLRLEGFKDLVQQFGADDDAKHQKMLERVRTILNDSSGIRVVGEEDAGTHLKVTLPLREIYRQFADLGEQLGSLAGGAPLPPESEIPNEDIEIDVWVDGETLTQMELDFIKLGRQFEPDEEIPKGVEKLAARLTFDEFDEEIEAPENATRVDLKQLMQMFFQGVQGRQGAQSSAESADVPAGDVCEDLKGAPAEVLEQYKKEIEAQCPELYR